MARALTTSEAVHKLLGLGFENHRGRRISDNEFTEPFGHTFINPNPPKVFNTFSQTWYYDTYEGCVFYQLTCDEYENGKSYLKILRFKGRSGTPVFDYAKADAKTKKHFMEVILNTIE